MFAMTVHATAQSAKGTTPDTYAVVLTAENEVQLLQLEERLLRYGVPHSAFREPDYNDQLMSIGIEPVERSMVQRFLRGFLLLEECHVRRTKEYVREEGSYDYSQSSTG
jgi:hypothetical protein